jgi:hypothetical protein
MEHFAFCVRQYQKEREKPTDRKVSYEKNKDGHLVNADAMPRCHGEVAMADAIIALTSNLSMKHKQRIEFKPEWFDATSDKVPEKVG